MDPNDENINFYFWKVIFSLNQKEYVVRSIQNWPKTLEVGKMVIKIKTI